MVNNKIDNLLSRIGSRFGYEIGSHPIVEHCMKIVSEELENHLTWQLIDELEERYAQLNHKEE